MGSKLHIVYYQSKQLIIKYVRHYTRNWAQRWLRQNVCLEKGTHSHKTDNAKYLVMFLGTCKAVSCFRCGKARNGNVSAIKCVPLM